MGTYGLQGVLTLWAAGKLSNEQAIGQILQLLEIVELRLNDLERRPDDRRRRWDAEQDSDLSSRRELGEQSET